MYYEIKQMPKILAPGNSVVVLDINGRLLNTEIILVESLKNNPSILKVFIRAMDEELNDKEDPRFTCKYLDIIPIVQ